MATDGSNALALTANLNCMSWLRESEGGSILKKKQWRLIVEIGGVAAVVVSLLVVVFELQQNTAAIRGATIDAVAER
jgi:hypothetical protein